MLPAQPQAGALPRLKDRVMMIKLANGFNLSRRLDDYIITHAFDKFPKWVPCRDEKEKSRSK